MLIACSRAEVVAPPLVERKAWTLPEALGGLDLSDDGAAAVLGAAQGESSLWTAPWTLSVPLDRMDGTLLAASFTSEGYVMLLRAGGLVERRSSSGAAIQEIQLPLPAPAVRAQASGEGGYVAFDDRLYALDGTKLVLEGASGFSFADDRFVAVMRAGEPVVSVYELGRAGSREYRARGELTAVALTHDGARVAAGTSGGVAVWEGNDDAPVCERSSDAVAALWFTRSGRSLVYASGAAVHQLDVESCRERAELRVDVQLTALDLDDDLVAVGDETGTVYVWDLFNRSVVARGTVLSGAVEHLRVHGGTRAVLAGRGVEVKLMAVP